MSADCEVSVGDWLGSCVGDVVGRSEKLIDGGLVGNAVGMRLGVAVGSLVGAGEMVGAGVTDVGD